MPEISRQKTALRFITRATAEVNVEFCDYTIHESSDIFYCRCRQERRLSQTSSGKAMLAGMPSGLRDAIFTHPTMTEGLTVLFAAPPAPAVK